MNRQSGDREGPGLVGATLTLLAGGAVAQAVPLLLGPLLTRLYSPGEFGLYHLFAAAATNVAVVACARYEFALPLESDDERAQALRALCRWLLLAATLASACGGVAWAVSAQAAWPLWLPASVFVTGAVSLATLDATRARWFRSLAAARIVQYGGGTALQAALGVGLQPGVHGLVAAPVLASAATLAVLRAQWRNGWKISRQRLVQAAREHRQFPMLNTPHAFAGALQDTAAVALIAAWQGPAAAGFWGLALRYLKAPATLVGGAVSQALYPRLAHAAAGRGSAVGVATVEGLEATRRVMITLAAIALPLVAALFTLGPWCFRTLFGEQWLEAGLLARALAPYVGFHFVAAPLAVTTMAWNAQAWALRLALAGQVAFVAALAAGLAWGGLEGAGWAVSIVMALYFGWYFYRLATWPVAAAEACA